jgi:acyl-CoA synthetase (NDP forming)/GNAT superfamily N-acetyltransferase
VAVAARPDNYPLRWAVDVVLSDGGTVHVRPIVPDDAPLIEALHNRLSAETVYLRFFTPLPHLSPQLLDRFVNVDYVDRMALVSVLGDDIVAVARYDRLPGTDEAEVAFVVDDAHQGRGLGSLLLEHLAAVAKEHGIARFVAETLPGNSRMLGVFHDAGFADERQFADGVIRVSFPIEPTEASRQASHDRERRAAARSVQRLLTPRSIAVIGASTQEGSIGHQVFQNVLSGGFQGPVYPVHPSALHVSSVRAFRSVLEIPDEVDLAVVVVPAAEVPAVVEQCGRKRVGGLVIISAGFAEAGPEGARAERALVEQARRLGMRVIGPNCMGVVNTSSGVRMNATIGPVSPVHGRVGFSSQSGALGIAILDEVGRLGIGVSTFVALGNKADVSSNDLLHYWEADPDTDVVLLYLESFGNPRTFARVARRLSRAKPIVAVKSARGGASSRLAGPGQAAGGSDPFVDALFHQAGVIRVDTLEQLFDVAQVLANQPLPPGRRVAVVGNADGPAVLAADACENLGLSLPELTPATVARLRSSLPNARALSNPVDLGVNAAASDYEQALSAVLQDESVDAVITIFLPPLVTGAAEVAAAITRGAATTAKPVLANFLARHGIGDSLRRPDGKAIPSFRYPESSALALARVAEYAEWRRRPEGSCPDLSGTDVDAARMLVETVLAEQPNGGALDPATAADLLRLYGVTVTPTIHAGSADDAVDAAGELGYPVVLKAGGPSFEHRSDEGGVRLGLQGDDEVRKAFEEMASRLPSMGGAVVQPLCETGVETVISVAPDPSFGPLVEFGIGGIAVDLLGDKARRILPLTDLDAAELVRAVRSSPLLFGYRGTAPANVAALEELLLRVSALIEEVPEVSCLELDPVIVSSTAAVVVDAKVRVEPWEPRPELAIRRLR